MTKNKATAIGCCAPVFWGMSVSLVRMISETIGVTAGLAINYIAAAIFTFFIFGLPRFKRLPLKYYVFGLGSAVATALSFAFSLAMAKDGTQAMEIGMVNYLWPSLTVLFAVLFNKQKAKWWIALGMLAAVYGIMMILSGKYLFDFASFLMRIKDNPLCYFLGLVAAVSWASYSNFTTAWGKGENPTALIFIINAIIFNLLWFFDGSPANFSLRGILIVALTSAVMGGAYGLWTYGVQKGNISIMGIASYFTPVLSCVFASLLIGATLNHTFWVGVSIVVLGSFICWLALRLAQAQRKIS